jgi:hypothetical protein
MLQQPLELGIPAMAAARNQRKNRKPITSEGQQHAAVESTRLIDAIDEAFAGLPVAEQEKSQSTSDTKSLSADLRHQTDSLAGLLAIQLQELDQQRGRLATLLNQIGQPASGGK